MRNKVLIIDNFDSFTWNLWYILCRELNCEVQVKRNNSVSLDDIQALKPDRILLSPGPGKPEDSGICTEIIKSLFKELPILGVCLGHQAIGMVFGAIVSKSPNPYHGKVSEIQHDNKTIYSNLANPLKVMRYHSLELDRTSIPEMFSITSATTDGVIMGIRHTEFPLEGIQFHPESILTENGKILLSNWLSV